MNLKTAKSRNSKTSLARAVQIISFLGRQDSAICSARVFLSVLFLPVTGLALAKSKRKLQSRKIDDGVLSPHDLMVYTEQPERAQGTKGFWLLRRGKQTRKIRQTSRPKKCRRVNVLLMTINGSRVSVLPATKFLSDDGLRSGRRSAMPKIISGSGKSSSPLRFLSSGLNPIGLVSSVRC